MSKRKITCMPIHVESHDDLGVNVLSQEASGKGLLGLRRILVTNCAVVGNWQILREVFIDILMLLLLILLAVKKREISIEPVERGLNIE